MSITYDQFSVLTFDTYGTLIDWESGILTALRDAVPTLAAVADDALLGAFATSEEAAESGAYRAYRAVLADCLRGVGAAHGAVVTDRAAAVFADSVRSWPAFPDSAEALRRLKERFRLAVITNCDTDLFAASNDRLGVVFDYIITAEIAQSYKPSLNNFEVAFRMISEPRDAILHVAQSLFHDHVPAKQLGMTTVWIDRRHDRGGGGATPPATATPDARFPSMRAFADAALAVA
jgi:2-haloacid dehalogenase